MRLPKFCPSRSIAFLLTVLTVLPAVAQDSVPNDKHFDARHVFSEIDSTQQVEALDLQSMWWQDHVTRPFGQLEGLPTDLNTVLFLALHHSNRINIAKQDPLIRETSIIEAESAFDWVRYANASWADTSEPIGNQLTAGGTASRFENQLGQVQGGLRRTNTYGGVLDISQRFGWQDNNSIFQVPNQQATSRLVLSYTHPLLRGSGQFYNTSLLVRAQLDASAAHSSFLAVLQDELLEITNSYWDLYLQRAILAQQIRLYLRTKRTLQLIEARREVDMQPTQLTAARSALATRRADIIRARTDVTNAETRLRGLVNAPELSNSDVAELFPIDPPATQGQFIGIPEQIELALHNRPELTAAENQLQAGLRQLGVAENELQPALNLVSEVYGPGLRGNNQFGGAFGDQFGNRPSYSVGLQYEFPIGNRRARARVCRRQHEVARIRAEYARATNIVQTEVDVAVREVNTTYREIIAKSESLRAAEAEVATLTERWLRLIDGLGTSSLNLESLLRSQERVTVAEADYATSIVQYNLALVRLKRSTGTLLQHEGVSVASGCLNGCSNLFLTKGMHAAAQHSENQAWPTDLPVPTTIPIAEAIEALNAP